MYYDPYAGAIYYGGNDYRDYIAHYGVKGMKWGKHLSSVLAKLRGAGNNTMKNLRTASTKVADAYTGRVHKANANRSSELAAKYRNLYNRGYNKDRGDTWVPSDFSTAQAGTNARKKLADQHAKRAAEEHKKYTQSAGYKVNQALHKVKKTKAYKAASSAAKKTIQAVRKAGKSVGQFAKNTVAAGKKLVNKVANYAKKKVSKVKSKIRYNKVKNKNMVKSKKYASRTARGQRTYVTEYYHN